MVENMKNKFWILVVFISILFSCNKNNPTSLPWLKIGHKWTYDVSGINNYKEANIEIIDNNNGIFTIQSQYDSLSPNFDYLYLEDKFLCIYDATDVKSANQFLLKISKAKVGDKWTRITPNETYYHELISLNESVTVPAGTFICKKIKVTFKNSSNTQYTFWSDDFGQIKIENLIINLDLKSKNF